MHQVAQFCEKHQQTYFGKCPQCPDPILSTTSSPALQVSEQADKEIFDKYDLMMEVKALQSELQKLREERDSALRSKEKAIKELLDRIKSGSDVWNELKEQQLEGEVPEEVSALCKKIAHQVCPNEVYGPTPKEWENDKFRLEYIEGADNGAFAMYNELQPEIQKLRKERDSATGNAIGALTMYSELQPEIQKLREERDSATASEGAVLELMVGRDKAFNAMRNALVELLADIRRKPNDTRYATQMRRAQEVLDKYPFIAKR